MNFKGCYPFFVALEFVNLAALFVFRFTRSGSFFLPVKGISVAQMPTNLHLYGSRLAPTRRWACPVLAISSHPQGVCHAVQRPFVLRIEREIVIHVHLTV